MAEPWYGKGPARRATRREEIERHHHDDIGDEAVAFARWYLRNKFQLMESFVGELDKHPMRRDPLYLRERFLHTVRHAQRVLLARAVVTTLLAVGAATTFLSTILDQLYRVPLLGAAAGTELVVESTRGLFASVAAVAGALTLVLFVARLALDRYLELTDVTAHYTAMQLAAAR